MSYSFITITGTQSPPTVFLKKRKVNCHGFCSSLLLICSPLSMPSSRPVANCDDNDGPHGAPPTRAQWEVNAVDHDRQSCGFLARSPRSPSYSSSEKNAIDDLMKILHVSYLPDRRPSHRPRSSDLSRCCGQSSSSLHVLHARIRLTNLNFCWRNRRVQHVDTVLA